MLWLMKVLKIMRQQNNGRRRQNRGSNRRNFNNGNLNGNINKNTVIDSSGPDGRQRGSVAQLNEKYTSLASDASSSDDRILAESFLQFADHYYRLQKEIELNNENKEAKIKPELTTTSNNSSIIETDDNEKTTKTPSRRKRGFQMREAELSTLENNEESNEVKEIKNDKITLFNIVVIYRRMINDNLNSRSLLKINQDASWIVHFNFGCLFWFDPV